VKGQEVVRWTQPADWQSNFDTASRKIAPGTIALQSHDTCSVPAYHPDINTPQHIAVRGARSLLITSQIVAAVDGPGCHPIRHLPRPSNRAYNQLA